MATRRYWMTMVYACDRCKREITFYLEDGCEGPRDGGSEPYVIPTGPRKGDTVDWEKTASGRPVLPVPFVAAGCPVCQPKKPWRLGKGSGCLEHVAWRRDVKFPLAMVEDVPPGCGRFIYPSDPKADGACGIPVLPEVHKASTTPGWGRPVRAPLDTPGPVPHTGDEGGNAPT